MFKSVLFGLDRETWTYTYRPGPEMQIRRAAESELECQTVLWMCTLRDGRANMVINMHGSGHGANRQAHHKQGSDFP